MLTRTQSDAPLAPLMTTQQSLQYQPQHMAQTAIPWTFQLWAGKRGLSCHQSGMSWHLWWESSPLHFEEVCNMRTTVRQSSEEAHHLLSAPSMLPDHQSCLQSVACRPDIS